jgi:hypothetical protein
MRSLAPSTAASVAALAAVALLASCDCGGPAREGPVVVVRIDGELPTEDPLHKAWKKAPEREVVMVTQNVTAPQLTTPSIDKIRVRALHDGAWVAFRIEWEDATEDAVSGVSRMSDGVAVQLPAARGTTPSPMMGHAGDSGRVSILHWRGAWQDPDPMASNYPNRPPTLYPAEAAAEGPDRDELRRVYSPAVAVRNPTVAGRGGPPAVAAEAEGFGTLSGQGDVEVRARGVYEKGRWHVVLARPIGDAATSVVAPGQEANVAFAVWDGSAGNVGSRKMWSGAWLDLHVRDGQ